MSVPPRRHRLPQRLDWKLIPAPLDLSKPLVDDNSPLPAIIVTPSSPSHSRDFQIAFLAPTPKEGTSTQRVFSRLNESSTDSKEGSNEGSLLPQFKPRTLFLLFIPIFLLFCHLLVHRLATHTPRLHFDTHTQDGMADGRGGIGWLDWNDYREPRHVREFIVEERIPHSEH